MSNARYTVPGLTKASEESSYHPSLPAPRPGSEISNRMYGRVPTEPLRSPKENLIKFVEDAEWVGPADLGTEVIEAALHEAKLQERERWILGIEEGIAQIARRYQGAEDGAVISALETLRKKMINLP